MTMSKQDLDFIDLFEKIYSVENSEEKINQKKIEFDDKGFILFIFCLYFFTFKVQEVCLLCLGF